MVTIGFFLVLRLFALAVLAPDHLIYDADVALDDLHHLGADVLLNVIRNGNAVLSVSIQFNGGIHGLKERLLINAGNNEVGLVDCLRALGAGTNADCRERMTHACEERRLFGKGARVRHNCKGIHLKAVVVMEAKGLMLDHTRVELEAGGGQTISGSRVAAVKDGHGSLSSGNSTMQQIVASGDEDFLGLTHIRSYLFISKILSINLHFFAEGREGSAPWAFAT